MENCIYKQALQKRLLFASQHGLINTGDLFDLNLQELDVVYRSLSEEAKKYSTGSLLNEAVTEKVRTVSLKMAVVKDVFETKQAAKNEAEQRKIAKQKREKLLRLLEKKEFEKYENMSKEEILKMLEELQ